jgi:hypothetical protein
MEKITEGTVPVPSPPLRKRDSAVLPVRELSHSGGATLTLSMIALYYLFGGYRTGGSAPGLSMMVLYYLFWEYRNFQSYYDIGDTSSLPTILFFENMEVVFPIYTHLFEMVKYPCNPNIGIP